MHGCTIAVVGVHVSGSGSPAVCLGSELFPFCF